MRNKKNLNILLIILYYTILPIIFVWSFLYEAFAGTIVFISIWLFWFLYLVLPIILLILPIIIKVITKNRFSKAIKISYIPCIIYLILNVLINFLAINYMTSFTTKKWQDYPQLRYMMIDNFEKRNNSDDMTLDEMYYLLGENSMISDKGICYFVGTFLDNDGYYCLLSDKNNIIIHKEIYDEFDIDFETIDSSLIENLSKINKIVIKSQTDNKEKVLDSEDDIKKVINIMSTTRKEIRPNTTEANTWCFYMYNSSNELLYKIFIWNDGHIGFVNEKEYYLTSTYRNLLFELIKK